MQLHRWNAVGFSKHCASVLAPVLPPWAALSNLYHPAVHHFSFFCKMGALVSVLHKTSDENWFYVEHSCCCLLLLISVSWVKPFNFFIVPFTYTSTQLVLLPPCLPKSWIRLLLQKTRTLIFVFSLIIFHVNSSNVLPLIIILVLISLKCSKVAIYAVLAWSIHYSCLLPCHFPLACLTDIAAPRDTFL